MSEPIDVEYKELPADVDQKSYDLGYAAGVESQKEQRRFIMPKYELSIENDEVYLYYPLPQYGEGISKKELVMTKEIFIKCYEEWILKDKK